MMNAYSNRTTRPAHDATSHGRKMTGTVKKWFIDKGYGFIRPDPDGADVFTHSRQVSGADSLHCGDRVTFEIETHLRTGRPEAKDVRLIED